MQKLKVHHHTSRHGGLPVLGALAWPKGAVSITDGQAVRLRAPDGAEVVADATGLERWADGSTRWALLAFRASSSGVYEWLGPADEGDAGGAGDVADAVTCVRDGADWKLDNGQVSLTLGAAGPGPIRSLAVSGRSVLSSPASFELRAGSASTRHESERQLRVLWRSPQRARVRIEGRHWGADGAAGIGYRLDVELWSGWPCVRLDYTFINDLPGEGGVEVGEIALAGSFDLDGPTHRRFEQVGAGLLTQPREVVNPDPVAIVANNEAAAPRAADPAMLLDDYDYPNYLRPPRDHTRDWLAVGDARHGVVAGLEWFADQRPKRLSSQNNTLTVHAWPAEAGVLRLPQGRSRRQSVTWAFAETAQISPAFAATHLHALSAEGRATPTPDTLRRAGVGDASRLMPQGAHLRFEAYLSRLTSVSTPGHIWHHGDTTDEGYTTTYAALGPATCGPLPGMPPLERLFSAGGHRALTPRGYPLFHNPVWTNNEYDLIHAFATEVMRTGSDRLFPRLRAFARHNIEVDFVWHSDHIWKHRTTPAHCVDHTTGGSYPSHFWTQGLLGYYRVTGDADALEVAIALGDRTLDFFNDPQQRSALWGFNREIGWSMLSLTHLYDATGDARYLRFLNEAAAMLMGYDRENAGPINLSNTDARRAFDRQMIDNFFAYANLIEALDHHAHRLAAGADTSPASLTSGDLDAWFLDLLHSLRNEALAAFAEGQGPDLRSMFPQAMAIAYERCGDERFIDAGMLCVERFVLDDACWSQPPDQCKPVAMLHRALARFLGAAMQTGRLDAFELPTR